MSTATAAALPIWPSTGERMNIHVPAGFSKKGLLDCWEMVRLINFDELNPNAAAVVEPIYQLGKFRMKGTVKSYVEALVQNQDDPFSVLGKIILDSDYSLACWQKLMSIFHFNWVFCNSFKCNVQVLYGLSFKKKSQQLINGVEALLVDLWFERNQRVFHEKHLQRYQAMAYIEASAYIYQDGKILIEVDHLQDAPCPYLQIKGVDKEAVAAAGSMLELNDSYTTKSYLQIILESLPPNRSSGLIHNHQAARLQELVEFIQSQGSSTASESSPSREASSPLEGIIEDMQSRIRRLERWLAINTILWTFFVSAFVGYSLYRTKRQ
ncbi:P-loop containing nucleoside triphosphate hydrolases superfamily protein isoform 2 [Cucumis melo var. makuwa]|uniref:P-loop containing nucleoside triphosphate hydrolases superfamily protein isoform 2 n=1 Tax=Cucumis melo var. makuwa TaxID=1194695 RepID=A0A5D3DZQ0_CUCMM|nr:P-loop containing nucleoside triphosphate hydrolases superfamily protein isoform 2 [Cucumis melo var. makuwa]